MAKTKSLVDGFSYPSLTSEGVRHSSECFCAEILCIRSAAISGSTLPQFFWRKEVECDNQYKTLFSSGIECFRKLGKSVPPHFIVQCCIYSKIDQINYGYIIATIKKRWETWQNNASNRISNHIRNQMNKTSIAEEIINNAITNTKNQELAVDDVDMEEIVTRASDMIERKRRVRF
jgi:hypothetical protein